MNTRDSGSTPWWRQFLGLDRDGVRKALAILCDQYLDAALDAARLQREAERMQYPQFRDKLSAIAAQRTSHADMLAKKIKELGGAVPAVPEAPRSEKNSWEYLLAELDEQQRDAAELLLQARQLGAEVPGVTTMLERILEDGKAQRDSIRDMLMKSDPQSLWPA